LGSGPRWECNDDEVRRRSVIASESPQSILYQESVTVPGFFASTLAVRSNACAAKLIIPTRPLTEVKYSIESDTGNPQNANMVLSPAAVCLIRGE